MKIPNPTAGLNIKSVKLPSLHTLTPTMSLSSLTTGSSTKNITIDHQTFVVHHQGEKAQQFADCYVLGKKLRGFKDVHQCQNKANKKVRSVRILSRDSMTKEAFLAKLEILRKLDSPNLIHILESFEDSKNFYVVTESLAHDTLTEAVAKRRQKGEAFGEAHVAQILLTLLECLNYCHKHQIIHGSVSPQNILVPQTKAKNGGFDKLLLINFFENSISMDKRTHSCPLTKSNESSSRELEGAVKKSTRFSAPEASTSLCTKSDIWSCGVIGYHLLTAGKYPFEKPSDCKKPIPQKMWEGIDPQAQELFQELLAYRPAKRPTAEAAYDFDWLCVARSLETKIDTKAEADILLAISKYSKKDKLQQAVSAYIATHLLCQADREKIDAIFRASDRDGDGAISKQELKTKLDKASIRLEAKELDRLFARLDLDGNGSVEYSEFLATQDHLVCEPSKLHAAFDAFDTDGNGYIEKEDLNTLLNLNNGNDSDGHISMSTAKSMIKSGDRNGDGRLSFEEFMQMMNN